MMNGGWHTKAMRRTGILLWLVLMLAGLSGSQSLASAEQGWVARYNGPANAGDLAVAIAVDGSGSAYVTGYSSGVGTGYDYATIKYDNAGNQLWVRRYDGAKANDWAHAIALDGLGNVYVTGHSQGGATGDDYATIKYDSVGKLLWVARYDGPARGQDQAWAITVDGSGNIYVTGWSYGGSASSDYATIKYDSAGNPLWVARYDGPSSSYDQAWAIAVDASGNAYVTGCSDGRGTSPGYDVISTDYATVKYDSVGNLLWVARYDGPAGSSDEAHAIALDVLGNAYVTGWSRGVVTSEDYATMKYDKAGSQLWVRRYNGPGNGGDWARGIAVDGSGNAYVTGVSNGGASGYDYATIGYDSAGNQLWDRRYDGTNANDWAHAIAVDGSGNVYVTGYSDGGANSYDYATAKYLRYDGAENQRWVVRYNGPANSQDWALAVAVDGSGNVYVTGWSGDGLNGKDYATVKYVQTAELSVVQYKWGAPSPGCRHSAWPAFEACMQLQVANEGDADAFNVTATITGGPDNMTVMDGQVWLGYIPAGASTWSSDRFRLKIDVARPVDPFEGTRWRIEYDDAEGTHHVQNAPQFPRGG